MSLKKLAFAAILIFALLNHGDIYGQKPRINSINIKSAPANETVTIVGGGFHSDKDKLAVHFGAAKAKITFASNTVLEVKVPAGATYDNLSVTNLNSGLTGYSVPRFTLAFGGKGLDDGSFSKQQNFVADQGINDICLCDFDGDLKTDVAAANTDKNVITVFKNSSNPNDIRLDDVVKKINIGSPSVNITCRDIDGDGKPDIVASEHGPVANRIYIIRNKSNSGTLEFESPKVLNSPKAKPKKVLIGDLNIDGKPEILFTTESANHIYIIKNESKPGTFRFDDELVNLTMEEAENASALALGDFNRDGMPDIVVAQVEKDDLFVFQNKTFENKIVFSGAKRFVVPGQLKNLSVVDLDRDTRQDIIATRYGSESISILLNNTIEKGDDIRFSFELNFETASQPWGIAAGDVDGDGKPDLAIAANNGTNGITLFKNNSSPGILSLQKFDIETEERNREIAVGDINGDGKPELVFTSAESPTLAVLKNNNCFKPQIAPEGQATICSGSSIRLNATKVTGVNYTWKRNNEIVKTGNEAFLDVTEPGAYTLSTSTSGQCVISSEAVNINLVNGETPGPPEVNSNSPICQGESLMLFATDAPGASYHWTGPDGFTSLEQNPVIENFSQANAGRYSLYIMTGDCKSEQVSTVVGVSDNPPPVVTVTADKNKVDQGETVQLSATGAFIYRWSPETGLDNPAIPNPVATIDSAITYTVVGEDENGCRTSAEITITLDNSLKVKPRKLFSPNGDRIDDLWQIDDIENFPGCTVLIFNRQGMQVLEQKPYQNDWDGTFEGRELPQGAYYYVIRCNNNENTKTGSVTLIR